MENLCLLKEITAKDLQTVFFLRLEIIPSVREQQEKKIQEFAEKLAENNLKRVKKIKID